MAAGSAEVRLPRWHLLKVDLIAHSALSDFRKSTAAGDAHYQQQLLCVSQKLWFYGAAKESLGCQ